MDTESIEYILCKEYISQFKKYGINQEPKFIDFLQIVTWLNYNNVPAYNPLNQYIVNLYYELNVDNEIYSGIYGSLQGVETLDPIESRVSMVTSSPTFYSQDGEFRKNTILNPINNPLEKKIFTVNRKPATDEWLLKLNELIDSGNLKLTLQYFGKNPSLEKTITNKIIEDDYLKYTLIMCLFFDSFFINNNLNENHMSTNYIKLLKQFDSHKIRKFYFSFERYGIKTIPVTIKEATSLFDMSFSSWREWLCLQLVSDLSVNNIAGSYCLPIAWYLVHNIKTVYFENVNIHKKFTSSEIGNHIHKGMIENLKETHIDNLIKNPYHNLRFDKLGNKIRKSIKFNDRDIRLSKYGLSFIQNYVGRTFNDLHILAILAIPGNILDIEYEEKTVSKPQYYLNIFNNFNDFKDILFEYLYSIAALHERAGLIHTDLHLNNITLDIHLNNFSLREQTLGTNKISFTKSGEIKVFKIGDKWYKTQNQHITPRIIDFGRVILNSTSSDIDTRRTFPGDMVKFYKYQQNYIMKLLTKTFETYTTKNYDNIVNMINYDYDKFFRMLCLIDPISITHKIGEYLTTHQKQFSVPQESIKLCNDIESYCKTVLQTKLSSIVNRKDFIQDWPTQTCIHKFFTPTTLEIINNSNITLVYDLDSKMKYKYGVSPSNPLYNKENYYKFNETMRNKVNNEKVDWESDYDLLMNEYTSDYNDKSGDSSTSSWQM